MEMILLQAAGQNAGGGYSTIIMMVAIFSVMALLLSELSSHTAATNMIGPLGVPAAGRGLNDLAEDAEALV